MQEITPFDFEGNTINTLEIDGEPYFLGKDIAGSLGYSDTNKAIREHVVSEDKLTRQISGSGQKRNMMIINESGLYDLVFDASRQGKNQMVRMRAKRFRHWVTSEVLPSIRKHGAYLTDSKIEEVLSDPDTIIKLATQLKTERSNRIAAEQETKKLQPKADYTDKILANPGLETVKVIAKNYGMAPGKFNQLLHALGVQYKQGKTWFLYAKYQDKGYTHIEPFNYPDSNGNQKVNNAMKWTQNGQKFIYDFLKSKGIVPTIESLFD